ncbi:putative retrotransposon protein [Tanacetum coccineum]|uniref:Retrotransposon protein n=1 Tax=Tanacetum coccineum TaxID=301880 RepID=A0ABQ5EQQ8_9ASTR
MDNMVWGLWGSSSGCMDVGSRFYKVYKKIILESVFAMKDLGESSIYFGLKSIQIDSMLEISVVLCKMLTWIDLKEIQRVCVCNFKRCGHIPSRKGLDYEQIPRCSKPKEGFRIDGSEQGSSVTCTVGNGVRAQVDAIGSFDLVLLMAFSKIDVLYFNAVPRNGIDEIDMHLTPPYTPQHNGVSERRKRTLLDMVRSMMESYTLPLSFCGLCLEVWGLRLLGERYALKNSNQRSVKFKKSGGRAVDREEIQEEGDNTPSEYHLAQIPHEGGKYGMGPSRSSSGCRTLGAVVFKKKTVKDVLLNSHNYSSILWIMRYDKWMLKTTFLNGYLNEDIYMVQPEGFVDPNHPRKVCKLQDPFMVLSKHQEAGIKDLMRKSKGAQLHKEVNRLKNVPLTSAVDLHVLRLDAHRPDVALHKNMDKPISTESGELPLGLLVECYCDAGFETDRDDTKSQTGYVFVLNGGAVDWKSSKQSTTAMSATESEYIAASEAAMEAVWIRKFISGLGIVPTINEPLNMYCDNSAAVHYANEPGVQKGARHYQRRYHYVRECVELGEIRILKVHTDNNLADPFTKALSNRKLTQHARGMGLRPASSFM